ncbi:cytochrome d ubiquinol oxidase subunit II [Vagococcus coleopterorum]|uniref:Cytochrome d ubiquinol oxidase subunit II n=1 Tax=Vagococcus coleopterorum TaxID=2714946 RepID=A0A6G8ALZ5_9ENTE|nr:cytochrome d ubiquinol oxidase subunit II [Vagococcus coleopterorum]QIL46017.1 cytochrome d ubiquinol oxidase subunit II [Vagococcus coleopterorum]
MSNLELLWFVLIAVLFMGFFILEGFDFGVGMATKLVAKNRHERDVLIESIGPVWDSNEVWLITAGGALFAAFPEWYASLFSGYYIVLFLILFALILRGVSFEFRHHMETDRGRSIWEWATFIGSTVAPFLFGLMFTSLVRGMPMDADKNIFASFGDYVNIFSIVGGIAVTLVCFLQGLNYIRLKTDGPVRERALKMAKPLYPVLFVGLIAFAGLLWANTDFFDKRPISTLAILVVIIAAAVLAMFGTFKDKEFMSFVGTSGILAGIVVLLFNGMFPRVMIGSEGHRDLLITEAASTPYTLKVMTIITCILLPIVLGYLVWTYYMFRKRINSKKIEG